MNTTTPKGRMRRDTRAILRTSCIIDIVGLLCASLVWFTGGMGPHGPHSNLGWFGLMVALGCIPSGTFFLLLGTAKWIGDRGRTE
jgi:hypothetical protein